MAVIDQLQARLAGLRQEYQLGEGQLRDLARREMALRETLLRIAGAIQVLEELLTAAREAPEPAARPAAADPAAAQPAAAQPAAAEPPGAGPAGGDGSRSPHDMLTVP